MARLIDADTFAQSEVFMDRGDGGSEYGMGYEDALDRVLEFLEQSPTVDAAPVVHGRWRFCGSDRWNDAYECSECGKIAMDDSNYCPNCGAKMDGERRTDGNG